ncbi:SRPBCC family protein [Gillisia limnaea]|uniref:Polyketide cyclase/dehydrase n=1 Tax=Gillisia limnaea (strain DSM 15749 / LMG 21470 / R-8282) TaxID=865937 RepID=H2BSM0_GILLR|nr:SRPBCC family protein [Gillisia limnaea]EHQ03606.1 Polyketide cyclase/dehydrase [Gillisia limnaea DSM 15749]
MKILKYLFFLILIVIIAGAIYIATKDGKYHIEETIIIEAPVPVVFEEVNNFQNWENWGPWADDTDDMIITYSDITKGKDASYSWKSEKEGDGEIKTTAITPNTALEQDLTFISKYGETHSKINWDFEELEEGTKVTWRMQGEQSFMEKLAFNFMDQSFSELMRPMFKEGLENLKREVKNKMDVYSINVDGVTTHGGGFYMYTTTASKINQIPEKMQQMYIQVRNYMESNNISALGKPFVLYNQWDETNNSAIYSVGVFTPSLVITPNESIVLNGMMPVQKVVKTTLIGDYKYLRGAWDRANNYISENNLQAPETGQAFELYKIGPEVNPNPASWITEIYIPLEQDIEQN